MFIIKSLLSLLTLQAAAVVVDAEVPSNDRCVDVTSPLEPGVPVMGDTQEANFDFNTQGICGSRSNERALWYRIIGDGLEVTVSVCNDNDVLTDFGVFYNCNDQLCLGSPPQQDELSPCSEDKAVTFKFLAEDGEDYHIHVRGDFAGSGKGAQFTIMYTQPETESNDPSSNESLDSAASTITLPLSLLWTIFLLGAFASLGF